MVSGSYDVNNDSDRLRSGVTCSFSLGCVWRNIDCCPLWGMLVTSLFMIYDLHGILSTLKLPSSYFQFPHELVSVSCWFRRQVWTEPPAWLWVWLHWWPLTGLGPGHTGHWLPTFSSLRRPRLKSQDTGPCPDTHILYLPSSQDAGTDEERQMSSWQDFWLGICSN